MSCTEQFRMNTHSITPLAMSDILSKFLLRNRKKMFLVNWSKNYFYLLMYLGILWSFCPLAAMYSKVLFISQYTWTHHEGNVLLWTLYGRISEFSLIKDH